MYDTGGIIYIEFVLFHHTDDLNGKKKIQVVSLYSM